MENKERGAIDRKQKDASGANQSVFRLRRATACSETPPRRKAVFNLHEAFGSSESSKNSSDQEDDNQSRMTKDVVQDRRTASQPISIPRVQLSNSDTMREDFISLNHGVRNSSLGDAVYNSPKLPPPSDDFSHVMLNLEHRTEVKRIKSCGDVTVHDSDGESRGSPYPMSVSLPHESIVPRIKGRRTVHFDETTITMTADLGESASRFRQLFKKKRGITTLPCQRFGESKTITIQHEEEEENVPSPELDRKDKNKSIFDVCNYSSYGRYT